MGTLTPAGERVVGTLPGGGEDIGSTILSADWSSAREDGKRPLTLALSPQGGEGIGDSHLAPRGERVLETLPLVGGRGYWELSPLRGRGY